MSTPQRDDLDGLRQELEAQGVEYLLASWVDIHGVPKAKCVPIEHFDAWARGSELYTVGALEGMGDLGPNEDECVAVPDLQSLAVLPWEPRYAIAAADLHFHGEPYVNDARWVLRRQADAAAQMGYRINLGIEPELYVVNEVDGEWRPFVGDDLLNAPTRGYDLEAVIQADPFLDPMIKYMNALGWDVFSFDHEGGDGQYEFDFAYTDVLTMADNMVIFRLMAKHVARRLGCVATFMPKPWSAAFGSGSHYNLSVTDLELGRNLFDEAHIEAEAPVEMRSGAGYSKLALHFTAGVLRHAGAILAVVCPTVNSYKRLWPRGLMNEISWAPVYRAWGHNNRTLMCRLPMNRRCLELRIADSASNYYLGAAITVAAGLEGIREAMDPGEAVNINTYDVSEAELASMGATRLPTNLGLALEEFAADELAKEVFGERYHADYLAYKRAEWDEYCMVVGDWEREKYFHVW